MAEPKEKKPRATKKTFKVLELDDDDKAVLLPDWRVLRGFEAELARWRALVESDRLPQVMLLHGRAGLGKSHLLVALAAMLACEESGEHSACGDCSSCKALLAGGHDEVLWLESATGKFLIEDAARLQEHLSLAPARGSHRIVLVVDADQMTPQAANRLLKTLEEPPAGARIILSTSRLGAILPTISSRCVKWRVTPPTSEICRELVTERLAELAGGAPVADGLVERIMRRAALAPGLALELCNDGPVSLAEDGAEDSALAELSRTRDPSALLGLAESVARGSGLTVAMILQQWEIELNKSYRRAVEQGGRGAESPAHVARRRDVLREAKRLAVRGKVPLNAQLTAEGLALAGLL